MNRNSHIWLCLAVVLVTATMITSSSAQVGQVQFGKNRVQYHDDFRNWWRYESENFITYWYGKARFVAQSSLQMAEMDYEEIVNIIEHRSNEKIEIIAYVDITDLKQSNIGDQEQFAYNVGQTKIVGNKMFVHFNGDHQDLHKQVREGMASIILSGMLQGGNIQEMVQNAVFLHVPQWYRDGLVSYISSEWNPKVQDELLKIFQEHPKEEFKELSYRFPQTIGHSFWFFLAKKYGKSTIANILYLTRINRDIHNAFLYVVGQKLNELGEEWKLFFENEVDLGDYRKGRNVPVKWTKERQLTHVSTHPESGQLAYVNNQHGKVRLYLKNRKKEECIFKVGYCNQVQQSDHNYPAMSWHPDGNELFFIYEKRDRLYLRNYQISDETYIEQELPNDIQRVYDIVVTPSGEIYFTGSNNGVSDLFHYIPKTRQYEKITDDFYDDLELEYYNHQGIEGIVFSSNRSNLFLLPNQKLDTILPLANRDLFFYPLNVDAPQLIAITDHQLGDKKELLTDPDGQLTFLSSKSGVWNRRKINIAEIIKENELGGGIEYGFDGTAMTDYDRSIYLTYIDPKTNKIWDIFKDIEGYSQLGSGEEGTKEIGNKRINIEEEVQENKKRDSVVINYFDVPYENPPLLINSSGTEEALSDKIADYQSGKVKNISGVTKFVFSQAVASRLRFRIDFFNTNLDNSLLFGGLDTYAGTKQGYDNPPLGILLKANLKDIFEDYVIEGGTRITTSFNGSEHFITFMDKKFRIDKHYSIYRRSIRNTISEGEFEGFRGRTINMIGVFEARYPFDVYRSLRGSLTFRNDRFNILASNLPTLNAPSVDEQRLGAKLEYVFDNTFDRSLNIKNGTRYKFFTELVKSMAIDLDPFNFELNDGFMTVLGLDFRHYLPVLKHSVLAIRAHGATSFGSEQILFFAGGMENWLFPSFNQDSGFPTEDNYAYQTIATNIRGFDYNARNGGTFGIVNTEIRVPVVPYFTQRKLRFAPLQNLQLTTFFDLGMAWFGANPLSSDNPANSGSFQNPSVTLDVQYFRDPLIMSYGWGIRTLIFGYYLKFDYAYGIETRRVLRPKWYLSLGMDF